MEKKQKRKVSSIPVKESVIKRLENEFLDQEKELIEALGISKKNYMKAKRKEVKKVFSK